MMQKLKVGVLVDRLELPAWAFWALERLAQSEAVESVLPILVSSPQRNQLQPSFENGNLPWLYSLLNRIDEQVFVRSQNAFALRNLEELLPNSAEVRVEAVSSGAAVAILPEDVERVKQLSLDILVQLCAGELSGSILSAARYGVWSYVHSDERKLLGAPAGYWEVVENYPETGTALKIRTPDCPQPETLHRAYYFTHPLSPARNRNALYASAAAMLPRQVEALYRLGEQAFLGEMRGFDPPLESPLPERHLPPTNFQVLRHYGSLFLRTLGEIHRRILYLPTWYLRYSLDDFSASDLDALKPIFPPMDRFYADPHVIVSDGKYFIFIEEYLYSAKKGHISVIEMDSAGNWKEPVRVLEQDTHLSYPFVFERQGKVYMIPESAQNRSIDLYECVDFPYQWRFRLRLMENVRAVDTTLLFDQDLWWMFTAMTENEGSVMPAELFLFYSDDLFSANWVSHPRNPIVSDIKKARPAGRIFRRAGKIYRPSQYISKMYGYGIDLNEILLLSRTEYAEKAAAAFRPDGNPQIQAAHTYAETGSLKMIDAFTQRKRLSW